MKMVLVVLVSKAILKFTRCTIYFLNLSQIHFSINYYNFSIHLEQLLNFHFRSKIKGEVFFLRQDERRVQKEKNGSVHNFLHLFEQYFQIVSCNYVILFQSENGLLKPFKWVYTKVNPYAIKSIRFRDIFL